MVRRRQGEPSTNERMERCLSVKYSIKLSCRQALLTRPMADLVVGGEPGDREQTNAFGLIGVVRRFSKIRCEDKRGIEKLYQFVELPALSWATEELWESSERSSWIYYYLLFVNTLRLLIYYFPTIVGGGVALVVAKGNGGRRKL